MSDSVWLHRRQPTRLRHPWDSLGKNTGVGFHFLMHESEKWKWSFSVVSDSLRPHGLQPTRLLCPWDFPGKSTGVGCHAFSELDLHLSSKDFIGIFHMQIYISYGSTQEAHNFLLSHFERCWNAMDSDVVNLMHPLYTALSIFHLRFQHSLMTFA